MTSLLRALNIFFTPFLTLYFASKFAGVTVAGRAAGDQAGAVAAGLLVLAVELILAQGPKRSEWLRRWLDPRAAFEGVWFQDVFEGPRGNAIGIFSLDYDTEGDSFAVLGNVYSADGRRWAMWKSTHMFIDKARLKATYLWEGEILDGRPTPEEEKAGRTDLELRRPPGLSLPMTGEGRVLHVGEGTRVKFRLQRVTNRLLEKLSLPFNTRLLRINAQGEEAQLAKALLLQKDRQIHDRRIAIQG